MIELLVGPIASGKSTYASLRAKEGAVILNDDALVMALHANNYLLYNKKLKSLYKGLEACIFSHACALGVSLVIDRTNMDIQTRTRYISMAKAFDKYITAVCFVIEKPEVHAKRRFESDARGHTYEKWLEIAEYHQSNYTIPSTSEGIDCIIWR